MSTYNTYRRRFFKIGAAGAMMSTCSVLTRFSPAHATESTNRFVTPKQSEGPFYPINFQTDKDTDLTQIDGSKEKARGRFIRVLGRVIDESGVAISDVKVEIWQANADGRYQHIRDRNTAAIDVNFQGWGISKTSRQGLYQFKTVFPGIYPAAADWYRPPHIHFKINKPGFRKLITQMYFPDQDLNNSDLILGSLSNRQQQLLIAREKSETEKSAYIFDIVLQKAG